MLGEKTMNIGSKEHYEILDKFEKAYKHLCVEREEKALWKKGQIYTHGYVNALYQAYIAGYALGRVNYI